MMSVESLIDVGAALVAVLAAIYARWSAREAKKANDIGRLNALLALRLHYLELINYQFKMAELLKGSTSGMQLVMERHADLDEKVKAVSCEIEKYHDDLIGGRIG